MDSLKLNQQVLCLAWIIVLYFCSQGVSVLEEQTLNHLEVCNRNQTCRSPMNGTVVAEMCNKAGLDIHDRCCLNTTDATVIIGINLQNCGITNVSRIFHKLDFLKVIMLEENPLHNVTSEDFEDILHIDYLSLSSKYICPGGTRSWENITIEKNKTVCQHEVDICKVYNVSCPDNSHCVNVAPGLTECLCLPGYHGYKCLRKGTFPAWKFSIGLVASTIVVAAFLWITQRRHVKKED
ncbi:all-trans retinoic acid-induced differentiation factor-like [Gigantopelta aegis]|uniref:all-trans retinoic acid-induced differentiation factor-like n=1 Tax=Gigantopelta aegis TaxID=1735272 RepID=UPI001B88DE91|nr:all-trans retinoic acid-induced differentiation factor-like [Gigantopelta aegis]